MSIHFALTLSVEHPHNMLNVLVYCVEQILDDVTADLALKRRISDGLMSGRSNNPPQPVGTQC